MTRLRELSQENDKAFFYPDFQPRVVNCQINDNELISSLDDGRKIIIPINLLTKWRVLEEDIKPEQLKNYQLWGEGQTIFFPDIDEVLSAWIIVKGLRSDCRN
jgi:hypothetical protein